MVSSIINLFRTFLSSPVSVVSSPHIDNEKLTENFHADKINTHPTLSDIDKPISRKMRDHMEDRIDTAETDSSEDDTVIDFSEKSDIEQQINDAETNNDNVANLVNDSDNSYISGIFFEIFGFLPIIFLIYWPIFMFVISKMCKVAQNSVTIRPRVAQPM